MGNRLKGQETSIALVSSAGTEEGFADVKSFDFQWDRETMSEGYLGKKTEDKDAIFKGVSGKIELHVRSAKVLDVVNKMNEVTKGRLPGEQFEIVSTIEFPEDGTRRIVIPAVEFGTIPFTTPGRAEYTTITLEYTASDAFVRVA